MVVDFSISPQAPEDSTTAKTLVEYGTLSESYLILLDSNLCNYKVPLFFFSHLLYLM